MSKEKLNEEYDPERIAVASLRDCRKRRGVQAVKVAENIGISKSTLCNIESGRVMMSINHLVKYADTLGLDLLLVDREAIVKKDKGLFIVSTTDFPPLVLERIEI